MSESEKELEGYYTIKLESLIEILQQADSVYYILCDLLQDYVNGSSPDQWHESPIPEITAYFTNVTEVREFLEEIINNPTEQEIKLAAKYNIKDVLITLEELKAMDDMFLEMQDCSDNLAEKHKIILTLQ